MLSNDIYDCFTNPTLAKEQMFKPFQLIDLSIMSDAVIEQHGIAALFETLLKHHQTKRLYQVFERLIAVGVFQQVMEQVHSEHYLEIMLDYTFNYGEEREHAVADIMRLLADATPENKEQIMTVAEQLKQQGIEQGIEQGIAQVAYQMLADEDSIDKIARVTGLSVAKIQALKTVKH